MNVSISSSPTSGPRSLISVCSPEVGSTTARLVRDSPSIRVKSSRIDSSRELLEQPGAGGPAAEAGRDHGLAEQLQRAGDVDALASGDRPRLDRAVTLAEPEVRDGDRAVDRGVECDGQDHARWTG